MGNQCTVSLTVSSVKNMAALAGSVRQKSSGVWKYFTFDKESNKSICKIAVGLEEKECGKEIKGAFTTNLKKHLNSFHKEEYEAIVATEKKKQPASNQMRQSHIAPFYNSYNHKSKKYEDITNRLAIFVGANNVALRLVDNVEFRELLTELDPRYVPPHRNKLDFHIQSVYDKLKMKLSTSMKSANVISICTDIWSKPGMTSSYLGVTAHFFSQQDRSRYSITLAAARLPSPHTAISILDTIVEVLAKWEIPNSKIFRVLTDNGSNMVAAFKLNRVEQCIGETADCEIRIDVDDTNLETASNTDEAQASDMDDDSYIIMQHDINVSTEVSEFEENERDHSSVFSLTFKRISCFVHTLQLIVKIFEASPSFKSSLKTAYKIVQKVNRSCKATEKLIGKAGKKLVGNCPTRWDSTYLLLARLVEVRQHLTAVLDELGWDNLTATQWKNLEAILELLQPFAYHTNVTSAEYTTTIAMVIPVIQETSLHLSEVCDMYNMYVNYNKYNSSHPQKCQMGGSIAKVAKKMKDDLTKRYRFVVNPDASDFDPIYVAATFLNPPYRELLDEEQKCKAEEFLLELMNKDGSTITTMFSDEEEPQNEQNDTVRQQDGNEPPTKRFKHLERVSKLLAVRESLRSAHKNLETQVPKTEQEIKRYIESKLSREELQVDPFDYWLKNDKDYPHLSAVALDILATPASTASVERIFSSGGEVTKGKRNRLEDKNLEREIFLRTNKKYI